MISRKPHKNSKYPKKNLITVFPVVLVLKDSIFVAPGASTDPNAILTIGSTLQAMVTLRLNVIESVCTLKWLPTTYRYEKRMQRWVAARMSKSKFKVILCRFFRDD